MAAIVTVNTVQGTLRGKEVITKTGFKYYSFKGIPYAKPPIGHLRFKAPLPPEPWNGILDTFDDSPICPQLDPLFQHYRGDEDCLFLNIYSPKLIPGDKDSLKAVMVWIHGGGFNVGSGNSENYGPDYLVAEDVVLVTLNYRLGPFGFLSLENEKVPGNAGLKDQVMALRWIQQNIAQFGGDPGNVTLFGQSAGGASAHYHKLSPMSKGLFHRVISQSGTALNWWALESSPRERAFALGKVLGCMTDNPDELLDFLQKVPAQDIVNVLPQVKTEKEKCYLLFFQFVPCVEQVNGVEEVFLPAHPSEIISTGTFSHVPHIMGTNSTEGLMFVANVKRLKFEMIDKNLQVVIPPDIATKLDSNLLKYIENKMREFYLQNQPISQETLQQYMNMTSDAYITYHINRAVKQELATSTAPVYYYKFSFDGSLGIFKQMLGLKDTKGVCHADDVGYLFNIEFMDLDVNPSSSEYKTLKRFVKMWTNFAKTGNPTPERTELVDVIWKSVEKNKTNYLNFDIDLKMEEEYEKERMAFWDNVYKTASMYKSKM